MRKNSPELEWVADQRQRQRLEASGMEAARQKLARQILDDAVAEGWVIRIAGGRIVFAEDYDPHVHGPAIPLWSEEQPGLPDPPPAATQAIAMNTTTAVKPPKPLRLNQKASLVASERYVEWHRCASATPGLSELDRTGRCRYPTVSPGRAPRPWRVHGDGGERRTAVRPIYSLNADEDCS